MPRPGANSHNVESRREAYIIGELGDHNILSDDQFIRAAVVDHLKYALFRAKHEGTAPNYGAILTEGSWDSYDPEDRIFGGVKEIDFGRDVNRTMADGLSSFVWSRPSNHGSARHESLISFKSARFVDELLTYHLRLDARTKKTEDDSHDGFHPRHDFIVLQHVDSRTRLLADTGVLYIEGNHWDTRPYAYELGLPEIVENAWPKLDVEEMKTLRVTADRLATIALHVLSAAGIGTTIVLLNKSLSSHQEDPESALGQTLDLAEEFALAADDNRSTLKLTSRPCIRPFESLARQLDGAFIVDPDGTVRFGRVWLNLGTSTGEEVIRSSLGGSRQRSAEYASASIPGIVLTVSSDGPVRAFAHGQLAASTVNSEQDRASRGHPPRPTNRD